MSDRQARLRRRRPDARQLYARRLRPLDVIHPAGCALEVLEPPVPATDRRGSPRVRVRVVDEYPNGVTFERELLLDPQREVLASRLPEHR